MATDLVVTVRASGGDYTTLSAAEAGEQRNLVTADEIAVIECYDDWPSGLSDQVTVSGWTTDSTRYVRFTVPSGHRHDGTPQTGFHLIYSGTGNVIANGQDFTHFEWMDIDATGTGGVPYKSNTTSASNYPTLLNCIARANAQSVYSTIRGDRLYNCLAWGGTNGFQYSNFFPAQANNCVAVGCTTGFNGGTSGSAAVARNCVSYNNTTAYSATGWNTSTSTHNATSSGSDDAPGGNSVTGVVSGDFADTGANDYHLASGSALIGAGTDLSSDFTADIDGDTRPTGSAWDIGFDHYVAAGGYTLTAATGAFALTGVAAALKTSRRLAAGTGTFTLTGNAAGLTVARKLAAGTGVFALTGNDVALTYTPSGGDPVLTAGTGVFSLTSVDVALRVSRTMTASAGSFTLTGVAAALKVGRGLSAATGAFALTGNEVALKNYKLTAEPGSFALSGSAATLSYSNAPPDPVKANGAGRSRRVRRVIEVDGRVYNVNSEEEAVAILERKREEAEQEAKVAIERAAKARTRPVRKVIADARKALEIPDIKAPGLEEYAEQLTKHIEDTYSSALRTIEVAALLARRDAQIEQDDEDILMMVL